MGLRSKGRKRRVHSRKAFCILLVKNEFQFFKGGESRARQRAGIETAPKIEDLPGSLPVQHGDVTPPTPTTIITL
jgi:hypothetical protein